MPPPTRRSTRPSRNPNWRERINALAPGVLAEEASRLGAWLVHYSTDYVFDGSGETPWQESDPTGPLSVYGQTKLAGEQAVAAACAKHLIFRTSWVYAARGNNFARTMLRLASERDQLTGDRRSDRRADRRRICWPTSPRTPFAAPATT
jgi:dTDP-4-dehydrorhamnose reductase